jgi:hypothetical protein
MNDFIGNEIKIKVKRLGLPRKTTYSETNKFD